MSRITHGYAGGGEMQVGRDYAGARRVAFGKAAEKLVPRNPGSYRATGLLKPA